jgi:hypothetical protein
MVCERKFPIVSQQSPGLTVNVQTKSMLSCQNPWMKVRARGVNMVLLSGIQMEPSVRQGIVPQSFTFWYVRDMDGPV